MHAGVALRVGSVRALATLILFLVIPTAAYTGQFTVVVPDTSVSSGERVMITLVYLQDSPDEKVVFPSELICRLTPWKGQSTLVLTEPAVDGAEPAMERTSPVKTFFSQEYGFTLPAGLEGTVLLKPTAIDVAPLALEVKEPQEQEVGGQQTTFKDLNTLFTLYQPYTENTLAYEPVYFLVGADPERTTFQISFKYRFFNTDSSFVQKYPWVKGMHFGYSQTSYWDLSSDSAPFADTSYRPEFLWLSQNFLKSEHGFLKGIFFQGGLMHESNGQGGDVSRSTNYLYGKPIFIFYDRLSTFGLKLAPKVWTYIDNDDVSNPDLMDYRGYFELEAKGGFADSVVLGTKLRWAKEGASIQLDISYPLHKFFNNTLDVYLYAQYSNMLAESLLDYTERTSAFRLGLAIVR